MAKRKYGEGSIRQRKDGRWEGRIVIVYDEKGFPKANSVLAKIKWECGQKLEKLKQQFAKELQEQNPVQVMFIRNYLSSKKEIEVV